MPEVQTRLKTLLRERHWQPYRTFCSEYDEAATVVDRRLVGTYPSKAQFHRWLSGDILTTPYPDACRVLEAMFPGWRVEQLFDRLDPASFAQVGSTMRRLLPDHPIIEETFSGQGAGHAWPVAAGASSSATLNATGAARLRAWAISRRESARDVQELLQLAGALVDTELTVSVDVRADGAATVTYVHEVLNLSSEELHGLARDIWFVHVESGLALQAAPADTRNQAEVRRVHETPNSTQFVIHFDPPVHPGEAARFRYVCTGGRFVKDHYWRQNLPRAVRHLTIRIRCHTEVAPEFRAVEGRPNGSELSVSEHVDIQLGDGIVTMTLPRDHLLPGQFVTIYWKDECGPAT